MGKNAVGIHTISIDVAATGNIDLLTKPPRTTAATEAEGDRRALTYCSGNAETAVTAATTDTLRQYAIGMVTKSCDIALQIGYDSTGIAAPGTTAADTGTNPDTACRSSAGNAEATGSAAATDTLNNDPVGIGAQGSNIIHAVEFNTATQTTAIATAPQAESRRWAGKAQGSGNTETTVTTTAADALR